MATLSVWPHLEKFTNERQERLKAQITEVQAEPLVTRIVPANYAAAKDLRPNLEKLLSKRGTIIIDARTNTMIITDTQRQSRCCAGLDRKARPSDPSGDDRSAYCRVVTEFRARTGRSARSGAIPRLRIGPFRIALMYVVVSRLRPPPPRGLHRLRPPANFLLDFPAAVALGQGWCYWVFAREHWRGNPGCPTLRAGIVWPWQDHFESQDCDAR